MEYMEIPTIPKGVLDNLLASMGSPATMKEAAPHGRQNNGYGPLPVPLFHGATMRSPATMPLKTSSASLPPLPGGLQRREASPRGTLFKDCLDPLAGGVLVGLPSPVKEKPKRVRKSRAGMTPKKRGISDVVLDANLNGDQQPALVSPPKRRRPNAKLVGDAENADKPPPRKRNRNKAKAKDEHALSSSTNETSFSHSDPNPSKGILGVYGLETKALDLTRYMNDISLEGLLAGDFNMPSLPRKQGPPPGSMVDNSFGSHVSSILQNLTRSSIDQPRPASLFSKPMESKPLKFSFDLESTPLDESEESLGGSLFDNKINAPCYEAPTTFLQSRKTQDTSSLFSLENIPVIPPADFWNTLQIHPNVTLNSLITQASANSDSKFFPSEMGSNCDKSSTLPPSIFSLGFTQVPQESACDRLASSKLNHWFRAESPKQDFPGAFPVSVSQGNKFPFKLDVEICPPMKPTEKHGLKEGLFDIDLNKQSPEAEAAETIAHSTSIAVSRPEVANVSPVIVQARIDTDSTDGGSFARQMGVDVDFTVAVKEAETTCNIDSVMDGEVVGHVSNKGPSSLQDGETTGRQCQESSLVFVNKNHSFEQVKDACMNASTSLPTLLVPDAPETQEMISDVPYSPGMQATARLLCRMAISSSPFYVEKDDNDDEHEHATVSCNDTSFERPAKAAKVLGPGEKDGRAHKSPALHESRDKEYTHKVHAKDGKEKFVYSQMVSNSTSVADKANGSEPWASTPPRHAPKNVASRVSGSQSSESDRSPCHGPRERTSSGNHGNTHKMQRDQYAGAAAFNRVSSSFTRKDSKGNHTPVSKTSLLHELPIKGPSISTQKKSLACETKQSSTSHGEGFSKISRPRSNTSKNCLQAQRSANGFPVQPRNLNGCSIKSPSSRHVLPYVGEVRHGSK